ncbi:MAG: MarR family transcriptional regulator [Pseudomonadota bacterium]|nr:MarR family transcriptional regulator [Pseudomonadota bacterium]
MSEAANVGERAPPLVLSEFLPYRVVVLGDLISRRLARAYEAENITIPEWRVLAVISQADSMAARDVVARTPLDKMAVSRAVASLEEKGLVERQTNPRDKRVSALLLSAQGRALFARIAQLALDYERRLLATLASEERKALLDILSKLETGAANVSAGGFPAPANSE